MYQLINENEILVKKTKQNEANEAIASILKQNEGLNSTAIA